MLAWEPGTNVQTIALILHHKCVILTGLPLHRAAPVADRRQARCNCCSVVACITVTRRGTSTTNVGGSDGGGGAGGGGGDDAPGRLDNSRPGTGANGWGVEQAAAPVAGGGRAAATTTAAARGGAAGNGKRPVGAL